MDTPRIFFDIPLSWSITSFFRDRTSLHNPYSLNILRDAITVFLHRTPCRTNKSKSITVHLRMFFLMFLCNDRKVRSSVIGS